MTETASQIATSSLYGLQNEFDPENMEVLPIWELQTDEDQRLTVSGAALASGYAIKETGGWRWLDIDSSSGLRTHDRVVIKNQGTRRSLSFLARESSLVKIMGELVNLEALQSRLESLTDAPHRVAVCAMPDARKGNKLVLAGELMAPELEELRKRFNLAASGIEKIMENISVPNIPQSALGKLDRKAMLKLLQG